VGLPRLPRPPASRDQPALEREVASPSVSRSWCEGLEETTMKRMSTMVMKLEHQERQESPSTWRVKCQSCFTILLLALLQEQPTVFLSLERA
jgi:hypothetical protein